MAKSTTIYEYTLEQAIEDGELVELFKDRWQELSGGKPMVATRGIYAAYSLAALREIWNAYVSWREKVMPTLPREEQLFSTTVNSRAVWVLEDANAFTILFPHEY